MNNNPNENLEDVKTEVASPAATEPVVNKEEAVVNQPTVESQVVSAQTESVSETTSKEEAVVVTPTAEENKVEQRVNLVEKPAIQGVIPNKDAAVSLVKKEASTGKVEVLEEVADADKQPASTDDGKYGFKAFFIIILFGGLIAMVFYLPEITNYIEARKYLQTHKEEKITTGTLKCNYESNDDKFDFNYKLSFGFTENKLNKLDYILEIRGDANLDEEELKQHKAECDQLALNVEKLDGINVSCVLSNGLYKQSQTLSYDSIDIDAAMSAYTEAGGIYPDYEYGENIDDIERNMNASAYTCERIK